MEGRRKSKGDREPPQREGEKETQKRRHQRETEHEVKLSRNEGAQGGEEERRKSGDRVGEAPLKERKTERERPSKHLRNGEEDRKVTEKEGRAERGGEGDGRRESHQREGERQSEEQGEEEYE